MPPSSSEQECGRGEYEEYQPSLYKEGSGCVEAPRGILFHEYEFDKNGKCVAADICIPTGQNHANIQKDFEKLVPEIIHEGQDTVRQKLEMLVRAYDPCISCSAHMLEVKFVK